MTGHAAGHAAELPRCNDSKCGSGKKEKAE